MQKGKPTLRLLFLSFLIPALTISRPKSMYRNIQRPGSYTEKLPAFLLQNLQRCVVIYFTIYFVKKPHIMI